MRRTRGWTGLQAMVVALGLAAAAASSAQAAPIMTYDTIGSYIGNIDGTGNPGPIKYVPVSGSSFLAPSALSLGAFQVQPVAAGETVTYNNVPFTIKFTTTQLGGDAPNPAPTPLQITGNLNGTVTGSGSSLVTAAFDQPTLNGPADIGAVTGDGTGFKFVTGLYTNTLKVADGPLTLVPSTSNGGMTTVQAVLTNSSYTAPVPEPSTVLLFAATVAGLGLRRQIRRARSAD